MCARLVSSEKLPQHILSLLTSGGIVEGDPVDIAIQWGAQLRKQIPVINPSHEKRPGGDWEAGI